METDTLYEDCQYLNEKLRINVVGNYAQGKSTLTRRPLENWTVDKAYNETGENNYSTSVRVNVVGKCAPGKSTLTRRLIGNWTVGKAYDETGENNYSTSNFEKKNESEQTRGIDLIAVYFHERENEENESNLRHQVLEEIKRIDHLEQPSNWVFSVFGLIRTGKSYFMKLNGLVAANLGSGEKNFMSIVKEQTREAVKRFNKGVTNEMALMIDKEIERCARIFETEWLHRMRGIWNGREVDGARMKGFTTNDGNDWKKYLRAPTCLRHDLLLTDSRQDDSQIGAREKTSKSSGEKEWTNPPRAATNLLRVSAVTIIYSISDVGQIGQGEQKSKSSGEKEWMNHPRAANILLRVSAETFVFSSGDVDKKGPKEKKSKSSMYKWEHSNCSETHNTAQQEYDKIRRCSVCLDKDACVLFFPCRHMTTCEGCADVVTDCPLCRLRIKGTVKINVV